jgi:hypothetical protein
MFSPSPTTRTAAQAEGSDDDESAADGVRKRIGWSESEILVHQSTPGRSLQRGAGGCETVTDRPGLALESIELVAVSEIVQVVTLRPRVPLEYCTCLCT